MSGRFPIDGEPLAEPERLENLDSVRPDDDPRPGGAEVRLPLEVLDIEAGTGAGEVRRQAPDPRPDDHDLQSIPRHSLSPPTRTEDQSMSFMQREMAVGIGRVADREVEMGRPGENPLPVRERLEAPLAVVAPHAAVTDAAEREARARPCA